jgi:acetyl/propionyl-CoA carboxylase alpha subunit
MAVRRTLLVANRGEIAVRIFSTCRRLGLATVAVAGPGDERRAAHARRRQRRPVASYLDAIALVDAARESGAQLVHPGYGFLAESAAFAEAGARCGPDLGRAAPGGAPARRRQARGQADRGRRGRPDAPDGRPEELGYPLLVKAAAGGGGRGMRVVRDASELVEAMEAAAREAEAAFGDGTVYCERFLPRPRHVEVQLMATGTATSSRSESATAPSSDATRR